MDGKAKHLITGMGPDFKKYIFIPRALYDKNFSSSLLKNMQAGKI